MPDSDRLPRDPIASPTVPLSEIFYNYASFSDREIVVLPLQMGPEWMAGVSMAPIKGGIERVLL